MKATQPKPIFVVGIPHKEFTSDMHGIRAELENKMTDYHVLVHITNGDEMTFNCFYEKDFNEVKFEELKAIVNGEMNKMENT